MASANVSSMCCTAAGCSFCRSAFSTKRTHDATSAAARGRVNSVMPPRTEFRVVATFLMCPTRSEEHTSELLSRGHLVCRLLLEKKKHQRDLHEGTPA